MRPFYLLAAFCLVLFSNTVFSQDEFITEWSVTSSPYTIQFPGIGSGYKIVWEKTTDAAVTGTINNAVSGQTISLPENGTYSLKVTPGNGIFLGLNSKTYLNSTSSLRYVRQWGTNQWQSLKEAFYLCTNMDVTATDVPNLSAVTDLASMFEFCRNLIGNSSFALWNTSNITNLSFIFSSASLFNQPIGSWITSNVTKMSGVFRNASKFNQSIVDWNTSNVTEMYYMFSGATNFNQPIGSWNTTNVSFMSSIFNNATSFNQSLANWNLKNVAARPYSSLTNMFSGSGMDCSNYSSTLVGWANSPNTPDGITLDATGLFYNSTAQAAHGYLVNTKNWIINEDFYFATCGVSLPVHFGSVSAIAKNNRLQVNWTTLTEMNNDYFEIEASTDGKNFKAITTIKTQAKEGNSDTQINYEWSTRLNSIATVLGFPALMAFFIAGFYNRRKKQTAALIALIVCSLAFSCSKTGIQADSNRNSSFYIRIKQIDKDGKYEYSKTVKVVQESF